MRVRTQKLLFEASILTYSQPTRQISTTLLMRSSAMTLQRPPPPTRQMTNLLVPLGTRELGASAMWAAQFAARRP